MTNVQERPAAANFEFPHNDLRTSWGPEGLAGAGPLPKIFGDGILRAAPKPAPGPGGLPAPGMSSGGPLGLSGILSQLLGIVQQLLSMLGMPQNSQQFFTSATAASTGDPHLRLSGTAANGAVTNAHYDSMTGHEDLLDSDSFAGDYRISTSVTQPDANGVTYNQQATVSTGYGDAQVSLDRSGNATISQNGTTISLASGESAFLGGGETVTRNADGSLLIRDANGMGGEIATTLSLNGQGVDVNAQASNVDLGGDLVNQV